MNNSLNQIRLFFPKRLGRASFVPIGVETSEIITTTIPDSLPNGTPIHIELLLQGGGVTNLEVTVGTVTFTLVPNFNQSNGFSQIQTTLVKGSNFATIVKTSSAGTKSQSYAVESLTPLDWSGNADLTLSAALAPPQQIWGVSITGLP
jgi:hypothetical protein